jgi:AcrR family transcriptional regulator
MRQPMSKEQRHIHILETARQLFQERGYDDVTIADVITSSNIARGTFYLHFDSLESLLTALFDDLVEQTWLRIHPILSDVSVPFEQATVDVVHAVVRMFDDDKTMAAVFYSGGGKAFMQRKQQAMYGKLGNQLVEALERRHGNALPKNEVEWTVVMLISLIGDMAYYAAMNIPERDKVAFEDHLVNFVLAGLRSHLRGVLD